MKKTHILDGLQVVAALLITSGVVAAAPMPQPATPPKTKVETVQTVSKAPEAPVKAPEPQKAVVWQDNPNHCTGAQWIGQDAPFNCIDKPPAQTAPAAVASVGCGDPHAIMAAAGQSESDFGAIDYIIGHEGGWCGATRWNTAGSGAYGICQSLPAGKMAVAGADWETNPVTQLKWCAMHAAEKGGWWASYQYWLAHGNW